MMRVLFLGIVLLIIKMSAAYSAVNVGNTYKPRRIN